MKVWGAPELHVPVRLLVPVEYVPHSCPKVHGEAGVHVGMLDASGLIAKEALINGLFALWQRQARPVRSSCMSLYTSLRPELAFLARKQKSSLIQRFLK